MLQQHLHRVGDTGIEPEPAVQHADALLSEPHGAPMVTEVLNYLLHEEYILLSYALNT